VAPVTGLPSGTVRGVAAAAVAIAVSTLADPWVAQHLTYPEVYEHDWGRFLRVMGFLPTWFAAALALGLMDRARGGERWWLRGTLLALGPTLSGIAGELLKLVVRRERPPAQGAEYIFRPWSDHPFATGGLGMPSSHTVVAFGAAATLARLFPEARVVWYVLAAGCGITRVLAHAHFLSDVVVAAALAIGVVALMWPSATGAAATSTPPGAGDAGTPSDSSTRYGRSPARPTPPRPPG